MKYHYVIIDDDSESALQIKTLADSFSELIFSGSASSYEDGLNLVLEHRPQIIFLEIDPKDLSSNLSLRFINELYRYLQVLPKIIITTHQKEFAFDAIKQQVFDYLIKPIERIDLIKSVLKLHKSFSEIIPQIKTTLVSEKESKEEPLVLCIKSYGDYRYIQAKDICFFQADNNSTDIHLNNGEMITAFKTLKHFETILRFPFLRIHNSYLVNSDYVARIHTGSKMCYLKNTSRKIPFSKSYKTNIEQIINEFSYGNYLEI